MRELALTLLPHNSSKHCLLGGLDSGAVAPTHSAVYAPQATGDLSFSSGPPAHLGLGDMHTTAKTASRAVEGDGNGREERAANDRPAVAVFFVAHVDDEALKTPNGFDCRLHIMLNCRPTYLHVGAYQGGDFLDDHNHHIQASALELNLGDGIG